MRQCRLSTPEGLSGTFTGEGSEGGFYIESTRGLYTNEYLLATDFAAYNANGIKQTIDSVYCDSGTLYVFIGLIGGLTDWYSVEYRPTENPLLYDDETPVGNFGLYEIPNTGGGEMMMSSGKLTLDEVKALIAERKGKVIDLTPKE